MVVAGRLRFPVFAVVCSLVATLLAFSAGAALAATPEAPQTEVRSHSASSVNLRGVLSPGAAGQEGTYEFVYAASPTVCTGESKGRRGVSFGFQGEEVYEELQGLQAHTTYAVCLLDRNLAGEETIGSSVTFTTSFEPETPETASADAITSSGAMLHGTLNPNGSREQEPGEFEFVYRRSASECEGAGAESTGQLSVTEYGGATGQGGTGEQKQAAERQVGGLAPNTQYTFCVRAWNATGQSASGGPVTFTTLTSKPVVSEQTLVGLGFDSASVSAHVQTGGEPVSYSVQYGPTTSYGSETGAATLAGAGGTVAVAIAGLQSSELYHYRFRVTNGQGEERGPDATFTTYPPGIGGLPDDRVYEMVSPPENYDGEVLPPDDNFLGEESKPSLPFQAAPDGNAIAYMGTLTRGGNGVVANSIADEYMAKRGPRGGWAQQNITPPGNLFGEYQGFSEDLSVGVAQASSTPPFVATEAPAEPITIAERNTASYGVLYARTLSGNVFRPLFAVTPQRPPNGQSALPGKNVPFGSETGKLFGVESRERPAFVGASYNGSHLLFAANDDLLEGSGALEEELKSNVAKEVDFVAKAEQDAKEAERLREIYPFPRTPEQKEEIEQLQEERTRLEALAKYEELYVSAGGVLGLVNVSPEGKLVPGASFGGQSGPALSHVISADGSRIFWTDSNDGAVFVRENGTSTGQVSLGAAQFWTASVDGRYAFYTESGKLWRFDVQSGSRVELAGAPEGGVIGVLGTNETGVDGSYVYFVSSEALPGVENMVGQQPLVGEDNLYVYEPDNAGQSRVAFVGTLSGSDVGDWSPGMQGRTSNVTPDGHALVFMSYSNLTGKPYPGKGSDEMYVFDANDGSVFCASCRPQASGAHVSPSHALTHVYRWISADGDHAFFDSTAPLVAQDVNGAEDVYEWERDGTGACREADGCVYLISNGFEGGATLVEASASGDDVFFATRQRLAAQDQNEAIDMYDARVGGVVGVSAPQCSGTGCQGPPAQAPTFATPSSVTFNGVGNFQPSSAGTVSAKPKSRTQGLVKALAKCHKKRSRKRRVACEKRVQKVYAVKLSATAK